MKFFVKLTSVFLMLAMMLTFVACNALTLDPDKSGEDDNEEEIGNTNENFYPELSEKIVASVFTKMEKAKTLKFSGVIKNGVTVDGVTSNNQTNVTVTVSKTDGKLFIYAIADTKLVLDETETVNVSEVMLAGGYVYLRDYYYPADAEGAEIEAVKENAFWTRDYDTFGISDLTFEEVISVLKENTDGEIMTVLKEEIVKQLEAGAATEGKLNFTYDLASDITAVLDYLRAVKNTDTVGKVINDALATVDPSLTVEMMVASILACESKTVNEAVAEIEAYTVSKGIGTLQEIWDELVAYNGFDKVVAILGITEDVKAQMETFKIADMLTVYGEYTVADVIYTFMVSMDAETDQGKDDGYAGDGEFDGEFDEFEPAPSSPVLEAPEGFMMSLVADMITILNTSFADMGTDIYGFIYQMLGMEIYPESKVDCFALTVLVEFDAKSGEMTGIAFGVDIDAATKTAYYDYDENTGEEIKSFVNTSVKLQINISLTEILENMGVIQVPSDDMIADIPFEE